jgi:hypothetical protein
MGAADWGHHDVIRLLLDKHADANAQDKRGFTPLEAAASNGHAKAVKTLIDGGATLDAQDHKYGGTALMAASAAGHLEVVRLLLVAGAKTNLRAKNGMSALGMAIKQGRDEVARALKEHGATE